MDTPTWLNGRPRKILLATDLSPRCDRALDRAVRLRSEWQAQLVIVHAVEERATDLLDVDAAPLERPTDPRERAMRRLRADLLALADDARLVLAEGEPAEAIAATAEAEDCDLIVTGIARHEFMGAFNLGKTAGKLVRRAPAPVLVVRDRPRARYERIVVAVDFSASSRHALEAAAHIFPDRSLTAFHAYAAPMAGLTADPDAYRAEYRDVVAAEWEAFVQEAVLPGGPQSRPQAVIESGLPGRLLQDHVEDKDVDLVVLGTHGRSALFEGLLGSVAKDIIDWTPCDVMVAREPKAF
jgi:nucleotide-binding universal stress UspA family protein